MKTLAFRSGRSSTEQRYFVLAHTAVEPSQAEWDAYCQAVAGVMPEARSTVHAFVATDGGGPNPAQRRQLAAAFARGRVEGWTHVFTTDGFVRGIVTAFRWIARAHATAHVPAEFAHVCTECGLSPSHVLNDFVELQKELPRVHGIGLLEYSSQRPTP
ncbi:MAG: hypothetical protein ABW321_21195 [Polyangiales bacterium]